MRKRQKEGRCKKTRKKRRMKKESERIRRRGA